MSEDIYPTSQDFAEDFAESGYHGAKLKLRDAWGEGYVACRERATQRIAELEAERDDARRMTKYWRGEYTKLESELAAEKSQWEAKQKDASYWEARFNEVADADEHVLYLRKSELAEKRHKRIAELREALEDMCNQFAYSTVWENVAHLYPGGLSALEYAFSVLDWGKRHPVPEQECEAEGCHIRSTCGTPTKDGYKRLCGTHYAEEKA